MVSNRHPIISSNAFHIAILAIGAIYLLTGAFHGNIWFDESYSVAICTKSFSDIWRIGSGDVHPVLYYWALHVIYLLGGGLDAYRVFTVFGAVCMVLLGFTHLRRDFGWRLGLLFSIFALFTPYVSFIAIEVRMYSWATCMVMLTFIYGFRIIRNKSLAKARGNVGTNTDADRNVSTGTRSVPTSTWIKFAVCSLAAAYLHYFALMSVFIINLFVLLSLISERKLRRRDLKAFWVQAAAEVVAYVPWLFALSSQLGVVSNTYWVKFQFPDTLISLARYPLITMQVDFAWNGDYGLFPRIIAWVIIVLLGLLAIFIIYAVVKYIRKQKSHYRSEIKNAAWPKRAWHFITRPDNLPGFLGLAVYLGLFIFAGVASIVMNSLMLYFRYMFCAIGPLLFSIVWLLRRINDSRITVATCFLVVAFGLLSQTLMVQDDYSSDNQAPIEYLAESVQGDEPVLSSDIGIEGVTAVELPDQKQYYLDWQKGNWGLAYECYSPALVIIPSWESVLDDYHGYFWMLGQSTDGSRPNDVKDLTAKSGYTMVSSELFYRPYERSYFTITLMHKD